VALAIALIATAAWAVQKPAEGGRDEVLLRPSMEQRFASSLATKFLTNYHYKDTRLDDELSAVIFERYLELLDPNRSYFLASDVQTFGRYRDGLDDALRHSDLLPAYDIFNVYVDRVRQRVASFSGMVSSATAAAGIVSAAMMAAQRVFLMVRSSRMSRSGRRPPWPRARRVCARTGCGVSDGAMRGCLAAMKAEARPQADADQRWSESLRMLCCVSITLATAGTTHHQAGNQQVGFDGLVSDHADQVVHQCLGRLFGVLADGRQAGRDVGSGGDVVEADH
jgi:hypothetical protein